MLTVVTEVNVIEDLNKILGRKLQAALPHTEHRDLTYPSGHASFDVSFKSPSGKNVPGWVSSNFQNTLTNFFVFGTPGNGEWLEITVQLTFPARTYSAGPAGAFLKDENGEYFVAHRGKLTRGMGALRIEDVLNRFNTSTQVKDLKGNKEVVIIAGLEDPDLVQKLFDFAVEARQIANELGDLREEKKREEREGTAVTTSTTHTKPKGERVLRLLGDYTDEFYGVSNVQPPANTGQRIVTHGAVVKALTKHLGGAGTLRKSQAIDLAVVHSAVIELYEVKTSVSTTDVYTGVGQLVLHGAGIAEQAGLPVKRLLVLPGYPAEALRRAIVEHAGIEIVTFQKTSTGYTFSFP